MPAKRCRLAQTVLKKTHNCLITFHDFESAQQVDIGYSEDQRVLLFTCFTCSVVKPVNLYETCIKHEITTVFHG
jgi:hypothetical protein